MEYTDPTIEEIKAKATELYVRDHGRPLPMMNFAMKRWTQNGGGIWIQIYWQKYVSEMFSESSPLGYRLRFSY